MKEIYYDVYRYTGQTTIKALCSVFIRDRVFRKIYYFRKVNSTKGIHRKFYRLLQELNAKKVTIDMPNTVKVGKGLLFIHPYAIAINRNAVIGNNFTMLKGATVGGVKEGKRAGVPVIGDNVYLGVNSSVVGGITIGSNVLIAANTFVDCDVPDNSLVIGCPGVIHHKEHPSAVYLNNSIENL